MKRDEGRTTRSVRLAVVALPLVLACSGNEAAPGAVSDSALVTAAVDSPAVPAPVAAGAAGGGCLAYGLWQACSVEERISRAGLAVKRREKGVRHDFMQVEGLVWETSRAEIQVFLYPSEEARKSDTGRLDTVFVSPPGKRVYWKQPATLVTSQNLAAIILSLNPRQSERIALALGAGLPAPPR